MVEKHRDDSVMDGRFLGGEKIDKPKKPRYMIKWHYTWAGLEIPEFIKVK